MGRHIILLALVLLGGIAFSASMNISDFIALMNASNQNFTDCIIFEDLGNHTMCGFNQTIYQNVTTYIQTQYNTTYTVLPGQTALNAQANISCLGGDVRQNQFINMSGNSTRVDPVSNNTYSCGMSYYPVPSDFCFQNVSYNGTFGETKTFNLTNTTMTCPEFPKMNKIDTITGGGNVTYPDYNYTAIAQNSRPARTVEVQAGSSTTDEISGNAYICKKDKLGLNIILQPEQFYEDKDRGIYFKSAASITENRTYVGNFSVNQTLMQELYNNGSCSSVLVPMCADRMLLMNCTPEEAFYGNYYGCHVRSLSETSKSLVSCNEDLNKTKEKLSSAEYDVGQCAEEDERASRIMDEKLRPYLWSFGIALGLYVIFEWMKRRGGWKSSPSWGKTGEN